MAKPKKATGDADPGAGTAVRSVGAGEAGGGDDAAAGAALAVRLLNKELRRLEPLRLDAESGALVALYARTLSAIARDQAKRGKSEYGDKSTEELLELALEVPELREALKRTGHAG